MLEQKKEELLEDLEEKTLIERSCIIYNEETLIDDSVSLYLITWSPDPKEMTDSDFYLQHNLNIELLSDYLKYCSAGCFCVESTQMGNPHYHGWYQVSPSKELCRIATIKTMNRFGIVKIAEARSYKINNYQERKNALYYYKKDMVDSMLGMTPNPITRDTVTTVHFENMDMVEFFRKTKGFSSMQDKISDRKFYRDFYGDTITALQK